MSSTPSSKPPSTPAQAPSLKRKQHPNASSSSGPDKKRSRVLDARQIATQSKNPSLRSGNLDIPTFIRTREFEINALTTAMARSRQAATKRAFQSLPRDMRRRTASHDPKRVPRRLRDRAVREAAEDNTPGRGSKVKRRKTKDWLRAETAKKLRQMKAKKDVLERLLETERRTEGRLRKPPRPHSRFRKRQREKTWLPTHVWHAKRAHMGVRWRFAVAERCNEKSFRPTIRAAGVRGAVAWDVSYMSTVLVKGAEAELVDVLSSIFTSAAVEKRVKDGKRHASCWAYEKDKYPLCPIAPATVLWSPPENNDTAKRKVLVRVHPSAFLELWNTLLPAVKAQKTLTIEDLRFELGSIEICGPAATDALAAVLDPVDPTSSAATLWSSLRGLTNPGALPPGAVLGFDITDPRLRYPPRVDPGSTPSPEESSQRIFAAASTWPLQYTPFGLLDSACRTAAVRLQSSQKKLAKRRSLAAPGSYPERQASDPQIPVILLSVATRPGGWTLLLPWKYVQSVWWSLMKTPFHVRFGGVQELRQVHFEHAAPWFPADFPGTKAGVEEEEMAAKERRGTWEKRPRQKRVNWENVPMGDGRRGEVAGRWDRCDWAWLLRLKGEEKIVGVTNTQNTKDGDSMGVDTAQDPSMLPEKSHGENTGTSKPSTEDAEHKVENKMEKDEEKPKEQESGAEHTAAPRPWHLPKPLLLPLHHPSGPLSHPLLTPASSLATAVFSIKLTLASRGAPQARARIYRLPAESNPELAARWLALAPNAGPQTTAQRGKGSEKGKGKELGKGRGGRNTRGQGYKAGSLKGARGNRTLVVAVEAGDEDYPPVPGEEDVVGFVTTGNFSLREGRAVAVGALAYARVFGPGGAKAVKADWCVVRDVGTGLGRLARWEVL